MTGDHEGGGHCSLPSRKSVRKIAWAFEVNAFFLVTHMGKENPSTKRHLTGSEAGDL